MTTLLRVLSDEEIAGIHEQSLAVLEGTGMRILSEGARRILAEGGAEVHEADRRVRFPRSLVEASLAVAPKRFSLGGRRPGFALPMNAGECTLMPDGESTTIWDPMAEVRRKATRADWVAATKLVDTMDEIGAYWQMVHAADLPTDSGSRVGFLAETFRLFSKHVQDAPESVTEAGWLLELLAAIFGGREAVRRNHPYSVVFCPVSPLGMEAEHTDAYLATLGWDIPITVMPMPMMGSTAPAGLRSTIVLGNAEVLGTLCLVQAAAQGTPFLYGPALAAMDPKTGRWGGGSPEHALLAAATTEMGRFYGLPVVASNGDTDHFIPGIQSASELALNWVLSTLSWPDILVGPGSLGGTSTLCLEQLLIDVEVYRACRRLAAGIGEGIGETDVVAALAEVGPMGDFLARSATRDAVRGGEFFHPRLGHHGSYDAWETAGRPELLDEAHESALSAIAGHQPLPLSDAVEAELAAIERRAREGGSSTSRG